MKYLIENLAKITNSWNQQPLWHRKQKKLYWADRHSKTVFSYCLQSKEIVQHKFNKTIVSLTACEIDGYDFIVTVTDGIALLNLAKAELNYLSKPEPFSPNNHFTGGCADIHGNFWAFTSNKDPIRSSGSIYKLAPDNSMTRFDQGPIFGSSSPVISADGRYLYQVSHQDRYIYRSEINEDQLGDRKSIFRISKTEGRPSGLTLDNQGYYWVCHLGGGLISRYNHKGERVDRIKIQSSLVAHCTFGGENLDQLFITTASLGLSDEASRKQTMAGSLLKISLDDIKGLNNQVYVPNS